MKFSLNLLLLPIRLPFPCPSLLRDQITTDKQTLCCTQNVDVVSKKTIHSYLKEIIKYYF